MRTTTTLASLILLPALAVSAQTTVKTGITPAGETDWYEVTTEHRPFVRWWWLGSAVDPEGLTFNLSEFARQGIGGTEITPIYGVKGNEANDIPYLSDKWMDMLSHTTSESRRLGLQVDMNNGTGWPFGGPEVTLAESARKHITEKFTVAGGKRLEQPLLPKDEKQRGVATLQAVLACRGDKRLNLTGKVRSDGTLDWKAPKGDPWTVYALFSGRTFQKVKRAAPGGEGYVINHYDSIAVKKYLDRFDRAFAGREASMPNSFFNDSYEVYGADWTEGLLEQFAADHGYRLEDYLPEFEGDGGHSDLRGRVVSDYRRTLAGMLEQHFTRIWTNWAHSHGARIRNQSHGSPANILDLYAVVDIPECESFGQTDFDIPGLHPTGPSRPGDADPAVLKMASSGAHLAGKKVTSSETLTWLTEHFRTPLARCKPELDQMFISGVNHVYFHGAPYSPKGAEFPGWMFYASINVSPTAALWQNAPGLFDYIARTQSFLTQGEPDADLLLFFPHDDILHRQEGNPYLMFDIHKMSQRMPDVKQAVADIVNAGYDLDYVSDSLLKVLTPRADGTMRSLSDTHYRAIIVPSVKLMQPQTLERLANLAHEGATVAFVGGLPRDVPGLGHLDARRQSLDAVKALLPTLGGTAAIHPYGKGRILSAPTISEVLPLIGVQPEPARADGLSMLRRRNEVGGYNYFVALLTDKIIDGPVRLAVAGQSAMLFDPLTGLKGVAETETTPDGNMSVRLQLAPGQSMLIKTFPYPIDGEKWKYIASTGTPIEINSGWQLSFPESSPAIADTFAIDTLADWTTLPDPRLQVNQGTGRYETTFTLPADIKADDWMLNLGDVRESARVAINGVPIGILWAVPFRTLVGSYLKPGINTITIDVTNLEANRIRDYEQRGIRWRIFKDANIASVTNAKEFSFADWEISPSGLISSVTLTPIIFK
ncbi:MAG: glycosyl hydrolase family 2 [Duncaniella sp.]|nr:glycosyl hydrolase family 2 [Duncaniella sp.]